MVNGVTSLDVAKLAQVSQSAVSRSFTLGASVAPATRQRVQDAAKKLGYRPNAIARSLITKHSRMIGVVMSYLDNQFYPLVLEKLSQALQQQGYHVLLFIGDTQEADGILADILQYQVDGLVLASTSVSSVLANSCADAGIPVVLFNRSTRNAGSASAVVSDNAAGGACIAQHLIAQGCQRIAFIAGTLDSSTNLEREAGFMQGLAQAGQRCFARAVGHYNFEQAKTAARELFTEASHRPDAVFVANDHMAIAVMDVLRQELGLRIPQDVRVAGFDDVPQASWGAYQLTSVSQAIEPMVSATVKLLIDQVKGEVSQSTVVIPCNFVARASTVLH
jgi:DNA-binding LacI/PurR family transcriptional regulator